MPSERYSETAVAADGLHRQTAVSACENRAYAAAESLSIAAAFIVFHRIREFYYHHGIFRLISTKPPCRGWLSYPATRHQEHLP